MKPLIFWEEPLRVAGPGSMANAVARLDAQLAAGRFSTQDRLTGSLRGARLCVWKASLLGRAGDVVEFDGELRSAGEDTVIEGTVRYQTATKIQIAGLLAMTATFALPSTRVHDVTVPELASRTWRNAA